MPLVVITGAARGIGRSAAVELARQGAEVAIVGREAERVKQVAQEASAAGAAAVHQHVASDETAELTGAYVEDAKVVTPSAQAQDDELARGLWERSALLVGLPADALA